MAVTPHGNFSIIALWIATFFTFYLHIWPTGHSLWMWVYLSLGHYYAAGVNETCHCLSEINISKADFIALYEGARMLEFVVDNVIDAWKEFRMSQGISSDKTPRSVRDLQAFMEHVPHQGQLTPASWTWIQKGMEGSEDAMLRNMFLEQENEELQGSIRLLQRRKGPGRRIKGVGRVISSHEVVQVSCASQGVQKAVTKASRRARKSSAESLALMALLSWISRLGNYTKGPRCCEDLISHIFCIVVSTQNFASHIIV